MLSWTCRIAAVSACCLLAAIGLLTLPAAGLIAAGVVSIMLVGPLVATWRNHKVPQHARPLLAGIGAAAATVAAVLVVAGLVAVLGGAAGLVVASAVVAVGSWAWRTGRVRTSGAARRRVPRPPVPPGPGARTASQVRRTVVAPNDAVTTAQLCATWRRSYWLLQELPPACPDRDAVVDVRRRLLDELERRDPAGFGRWLRTEPRAGSDPGRYLIADH